MNESYVPRPEMKETGECPHCQKGTLLYFSVTAIDLAHDVEMTSLDSSADWRATHVRATRCALCKRKIIELGKLQTSASSIKWESWGLVYPREKKALTPSLPPEIPPAFADDFNEARAVLSISPKASAAPSADVVCSV